MKKRYILMLMTVVMLCAALLYGCSREPVDNNFEIEVEIGDELFGATVIGILENFDIYEGKTVRLEGVYEHFGTEDVYRTVLRRLGTC
jgi:hypothetical protein